MPPAYLLELLSNPVPLPPDKIETTVPPPFCCLYFFALWQMDSIYTELDVSS